jgi:peptidoglycan/LPS O-acetylase OafA/YrhL
MVASDSCAAVQLKACRFFPVVHSMRFDMGFPELDNTYRPDVDGLRALAVGMIVAFHLRIGGFEGGYAGVDIFFVISGYLIIGRILRDIASERFSFSEFYARRARRILPALVTTVLISFVAGLLWLPPEFLGQFAKEATRGILSIANIQYWREWQQYFAPSSEQLGLLHLWSLSLEEQFYLCCPLLLVLLSRTKYVFSGIAAAGMASVLAACFWITRDPEAVFFLLPFRVFEFALGALAIPLERWMSHSVPSRICSTAIGYLVILGALPFLGRLQQYGGLAALPVCIATALIIAADWPTFLLTNSSVLAIGRGSYSLYLVHWPVIFFARFVFGGVAETPFGILNQLAVMAALTAAIHLFVEQPLRRRHLQLRKQAVVYSLAIVAGVIVTQATFRAEGASWRLDAEEVTRTNLQDFGMSPCMRYRESCAFGDLNGRRTLVLVGDSFVQHYVAALNDRLERRGIKGLALTKGGCLMLVDLVQAEPRNEECSELRDNVLKRVKMSSAEWIVIGHSWDSYQFAGAAASLPRTKLLADGVLATIDFLARPGRQFLVIGQQVMPVGCKFDRMRMMPGPLWHRPLTCDPVLKEHSVIPGWDMDDQLAKRLQGRKDVTLLRPVDVYCDAECPVVADGLWLFQDDGHFTVAGSRRMGDRAKVIIDRFLSDAEGRVLSVVK